MTTPAPRRFPPFAFISAIIGYVGYFAANIGFSVVMLPALALFPWIQPGLVHRIFKGYLHLLTRWYLPSLGIYRIREISGLEIAENVKPAIYVANHRGRLDGPLLLSLIKNPAVVIKASYGKNILYSAFVKHLDFISVGDESLSSLGRARERCRQALGRGQNLLLFPEGTRARSGRLQTFKDLAFRLATELDIPIIPVIIHSDYPFMARLPGSIFPLHQFGYTIRFLSPQYPKPKQSPADLSWQVRELMIDCIHELDKGTIWEVKR